MTKLTQKGVKDALVKVRGNISAVARAFGVTRHAIQLRVNQDPELLQIILDARETLTDNAVDKLGEAVDNGCMTAITYTLSRLGRSRGYIDKQEIEMSGSQRLRVIEEVVSDVEFAAGEPGTTTPASEAKPVP